jgi:hypothetical protein
MEQGIIEVPLHKKRFLEIESGATFSLSADRIDLQCASHKWSSVLVFVFVPSSLCLYLDIDGTTYVLHH